MNGLHPRSWFSLLVFALMLSRASAGPASQGHRLQFNESYALAADRSKALELLIPGTPDFYYYHCLDRHAAKDFQRADELLQLWQERHPRDARLGMMQNRQALLSSGEDPGGSFKYLEQELGLGFRHARNPGGQAGALASRLNPAHLERERLVKNAFGRHPNSLDGFHDAALESLVGMSLTDAALRELLGRLQRPDVPGLVPLVLMELSDPRSRGFGSLGIHRQLLLGQLEQCARQSTSLLGDQNFVQAYLERLWPSADVRWQADHEAREAYLDRLQSFAVRLPDTQNSLKAHVLYHRLAHDLELGKPDRERFLAYLRLPNMRSGHNREYLNRFTQRGQFVDLDSGFPTGLSTVRNDEALVRAYLSHWFQEAGSYSAYAEFLDDRYLRQLFAETKILAGEGDMERWYSLLDDPAYYERLRARVEIEFSPSQPRYYAAEESVAIDVDLKNVGTLLVKVFEINTFNYYKDQGQEIDASIDLDGLVAGSERTIEFTDSPLRRVHRRFELPELSRPGVYVVDLIGNGLSSRAVIHKGKLQLHERNSAAGHLLQVTDESGRWLKDASVWFGDREYEADQDGEVLIPYGTAPGMAQVLLQHGEQTSLSAFRHAAEFYSLKAGILVERESLIAGGSAQVVVRAGLSLNGNSISLGALEEATLLITSYDQEGVSTQLEIADFKLSGTQESVQRIQVAPGLAQLEVNLRGRVQSLSTGKPIPVSSTPVSFHLNAIDASLQTESPILGRNQEGYVLDLLGKNGEPKAGRVLNFNLALREFRDVLALALETDAAGRIHLGELPGVESISISGFPEMRTWNLATDRRSLATEWNGLAGETLRIPYPGTESTPTRRALSLIELRHGAFAFDRFDHLSLAGGYLELRDLAAGDYELWLKESSQQVLIRISAGSVQAGRILGRDRHLEASSVEMQISELGIQGDELVLRLANPGPDASVHVFSTRYLPAYDPFSLIFPRHWSRLQLDYVDHPSASYHSGREISDEYRYILERRFASALPGNMLKRPGLILNPWALEETESVIGIGGGSGGRFGGKRNGGGPSSPAASMAPRMAGPDSDSPGTFPNLDFLPLGQGLELNLRPDVEGIVRVPLAKLGQGSLLHVLAVDAASKVYRSLVRPEQALLRRDQRLLAGLDPSQHYAQQQRIEYHQAGGEIVVEDASNAKLKLYGDLRSVHQLYSSLSGNPDLSSFEFLLDWPKLTPEEQRERYSKFACHELHFFLHEKDPDFFAAVVKPYLANKIHKTFLDEWLLDFDLMGYLDAWRFEQLNTFEQILLTRRIAGQKESGVRHLRELLELRAPDLERQAHLFRSALRSGSLEESGALGLVLGEMKDELAARFRGPGDTVPPYGKQAEGPDDLNGLGYSDDSDAEELPEETLDSSEFFLGRGEAEAQKALGMRGKARQLYRGPDPTRAFVESNYWHLTAQATTASLISPNAFWLDYARSSEEQAFGSEHFAEASGSLAEMILALAVLDLPFEAGEETPSVEGQRLSMRAAAPLILVSEQIRPSSDAEEALPILVSQSFFREDDRYRYEQDQRYDKHVTEEFLIGVAYGVQVVVTNPTSSIRDLELLLQIPVGAIPLQRGFKTRGTRVQLQPYGTQTAEFRFYFPAPGQFEQYPVHVSRSGERIASATPMELKVVPRATQLDTQSWAHVSQNGSSQEVLDFLAQANLSRLDLSQVAWRMKEKSFFLDLIAHLRARHHFSEVLWSYGIHHRELGVAREYLGHLPSFLAACGAYLDSDLVRIDPVERKLYQQVEFAPLINPRAHRLGREREILDRGFAAQYESLLSVLCLRAQLDDEDWMSVTYYLLLQDRVAEAQVSFARVDSSQLPTQIQFDYMRAYMDFFTPGHQEARAIAAAYAEHPVARWRKLFQEVTAQLDEAEGQSSALVDPEDLAQQQTELVRSEPAMELKVESKRITVEHQNLQTLTLNFYEMDIEFLFSTSPFVQESAGSFAYIRPNKSLDLALKSGATETQLELPGEFLNSNVLVELRGAGLLRRQAHYANSMTLGLFESYGQLKVSEDQSGKPLAAVYIKVFARDEDGVVRFHKDGYTDLRGRFDYASLSGASDLPAERFSILVLSPSHGALIREVTPPKR